MSSAPTEAWPSFALELRDMLLLLGGICVARLQAQGD